jgi:hypothetical protein
MAWSAISVRVSYRANAYKHPRQSFGVANDRRAVRMSALRGDMPFTRA